MRPDERNTASRYGPTTTAAEWCLRSPGLFLGKAGENQVHEFTGMWPLKPDADLVALARALAPGGWINPAGESFSTMTTKLGVIRGARWFVARTQDFDDYTLFFACQFDHSVEELFDAFMLNGKENLAAIWGQCVGCPTGPDVTARDIVRYIATGQIKTLACYDAYPSLSIPQIHKLADCQEKTQRFQQAVSAGGGKLEDKVNAFLQELAAPYQPVPSGAAVDTDVVHLWQYEDVRARLNSLSAVSRSPRVTGMANADTVVPAGAHVSENVM